MTNVVKRRGDQNTDTRKDQARTQRDVGICKSKREGSAEPALLTP